MNLAMMKKYKKYKL